MEKEPSLTVLPDRSENHYRSNRPSFPRIPADPPNRSCRKRRPIHPVRRRGVREAAGCDERRRNTECEARRCWRPTRGRGWKARKEAKRRRGGTLACVRKTIPWLDLRIVLHRHALGGELEGSNGPSKWRERRGTGAEGRGRGRSCWASAINPDDVGEKGDERKKLLATYHRQTSIQQGFLLQKGCMIDHRHVPNE